MILCCVFSSNSFPSRFSLYNFTFFLLFVARNLSVLRICGCECALPEVYYYPIITNTRANIETQVFLLTFVLFSISLHSFLKFFSSPHSLSVFQSDLSINYVKFKQIDRRECKKIYLKYVQGISETKRKQQYTTYIRKTKR